MIKKKAPPELFFNDALAIEMGHAIHSADTHKIKALAQKIDINARGKGKDGMTFLIWTMTYGSFSAYQTLLDLGANTELTSEVGHTALGVATHSDLPWVKALIGAGADINKRVEVEPVWWGAYMGHNWPVFDYFLEQSNLDVNAQDGGGYTLIMTMAGLGDYDQVIKLLDKDADISIRLKTSLGISFPYIVQETPSTKSSRQYPYYQEVLKRMKAQGIVLPVEVPIKLRHDKGQ